MNFERSAGILLHPTSLPGKYGIGDLGNEAYSFIDFLVEAGQTLWQVFPLGPTGYGDSPYQCFSAFAGNPLLVSPDKLKEDGFLSDDDLPALQVGFNNPPLSDPKKVDFGNVIEYKKKILRNAFNNFKKNSNGLEKDFRIFCDENKEWLDDFSLFIACKDAHNGAVWSEWEMGLINREETAIKEWSNKLSDDIFYHKFVQFVFFKQWKELREYTNEKGIKIIGDMPIFIAYDSSDLWANKKLFTVDENGKLTFVAGVPPDYFSETGQLWGNPLYKWDEMEKDEFLWWRKRFTSLLEFVDIIRIDHFRGFEAYWKIPGEAETAINGKWVKAPGDKLFEIVKKYLGDIPILAEDLGVITPPVEALRDQFGFPGMKVLQFAFGTGMETKFLPHNFIPNCVVYTGTHDNDTTKAYFEKEKMNKKNDIYDHAQKYLNYNGKDILSELIRTAYASVANIVVIPMQDIMNLGGDARMNFPSTLGGGNWAWRFTWDQ
ncbi:MAG: 4-alpha-glucanotransferase, partial [Ignavibacteria bacterium]|nr:4-alpha-glucanotransferase [Ignavibacteria bacterium]